MWRACLITQFLFILLLKLGALDVHQGLAVGCHDTEREALLKFKQSLSNLSNWLPSWKGKGCCDWEGVGCDNVTAFVNRLDVHNPYYYQPTVYFTKNRASAGIIPTSEPYLPNKKLPPSPKLDPSLLELRHLNYLDLSCNDFQRSQIPEFIGTFKYLRYLNLSHSNFVGIVPFQLGNLTRLQTLDLSSLGNGLSSDLHWVSKLVSLQYLNFGGNQLLGGTLLYVLANMTSLTYLDLSSTELNSSIPLCLGNMISLTYLDLSNNQLNGSIPLRLGNMTSLTYLDLSNNQLNGSIPLRLGNMTSLTYLDLSENILNGSIPLSMRSMTKLEYLDLSSNSFSSVEGGAIMGILGNLCKLVNFDLSHNFIGGSLEANHKNFSKCVSYDLENLKLGGNEIGGMLPSSLRNFKYLRVLDISSNRLNGPLNGALPQGLGQWKSLVHIDLSSNFLQGVLSEYHLDNLSSLESLDLSFNTVEWNISFNWSPPFQLSLLIMASCKIESPFPRWIDEQTKLSTLDFSDNNISGELPQCFTSNQLTYINISHNRITGPVPYFSSHLETIDLSYNLLSGSLVHHDPSTKNDRAGTPICQLYSLGILNLQMNKISGGISDCWVGLEDLAYINLASNNLSGIIPLSMGLLSELAFLKLSNNSLQGLIPPTLSTSSSLQILDLGENKLVGNIPSDWGTKTRLELLRLRGNQLVGSIPLKLCSINTLQFIDLSVNNLTGGIPRCFGHLLQMESSNVHGLPSQPAYSYTETEADNIMVVLKGAELQYTTTLKYVVNLDLSCNALTGSIPEEITNLSALIGLNLSHNHLTGNIPDKIGEMTSLESLDLSNNNISGTIPPSISALTSLVCLNLSYNRLQGEIPTGHQLQVLENPTMTYIGNPGLCGDPLPNKCRTNQGEDEPIQGQEKSDKEKVWEKPLLYLVIMSGFATGFWGVVGSLLLNRRFRFALFQVMGKVVDYMYVQVMIRLNRLRN